MTVLPIASRGIRVKKNLGYLQPTDRPSQRAETVAIASASDLDRNEFREIPASLEGSHLVLGSDEWEVRLRLRVGDRLLFLFQLRVELGVNGGRAVDQLVDLIVL